MAEAHFYPSRMFEGKAGGYKSGAPYETPIKWQAPTLTHKYYTCLEVNEIGKHSSLLRNGNNYCCKKFYSTGPHQFINYGEKSFVISALSLSIHSKTSKSLFLFPRFVRDVRLVII
jgi:hypothetical protein